MDKSKDIHHGGMRGQKLICKLKATFILFYIFFCFTPIFVYLQNTNPLPHCPIFDHRKKWTDKENSRYYQETSQVGFVLILIKPWQSIIVITPESWPTVIYFLRSNYVLDFFFILFFLKHVFSFFLFIIFFLPLNRSFIYFLYLPVQKKALKLITDKYFV